MLTLTYRQMREVSKKIAAKTLADYSAKNRTWAEYEPTAEVQALRDAAMAMDCRGAEGVVALAKALRPDMTLSDMDKEYVLNGKKKAFVPRFMVLKQKVQGGLTAEFVLYQGDGTGFALKSKTKGGGRRVAINPETQNVDIANNDEAGDALERVYLTREFQRYLESILQDMANDASTDETEVLAEDIVDGLLAE